MDSVDIFNRTLAEVDTVVRNVAPSQLDDSTPCSGWTVRHLINHLVQVNFEFAAIADGQPPPDRGGDPVHDDQTGTDYVAAFRAATVVARAAFSRRGMPEQIYQFPWGEEPGAKLVQHVADELLIHGWDVAKATGQATDFSPDLVATSLQSWQAWFADLPRAETPNFGPEQPVHDGATDADRLAAYLGREL